MTMASIELEFFSKAKILSWYYSCDVVDYGFFIANSKRILSETTAHFFNVRSFFTRSSPSDDLSLFKK